MECISTVVPCYNEESVLESFYNEISKVASEMKNVKFEFLFIDDGSKDETLNIINNFKSFDSRVSYISFSKNFGKEAAIYAGLENAVGEYVVIIDADLQHPPRLIKDMYYGIAIEGYDSVAAYRKNRKGEGVLRTFFSKKFFKVASRLTHLEFRQGEEDYRMMNRKFVKSVLSIKEKNRFSKGIFQWVGFKVKWIEHENINRIAGTSKWSIIKLFIYSLDGIMGFSTTPLTILSISGIILIIVALIILIGMLINKFIVGEDISNIVYITMLMIFFSGIQLVSSGVLGAYLAKGYLEVKERPLYIVDEKDLIENKDIEDNEEFKIKN